MSQLPHTMDHQSQDILRKFQWAIKRVGSEFNSEDKDSAALTQEELIQLIRVWEPQRDIICLYVRWARQLKRNFNLDSIATLLCLSRQCNYKPIDFLRKVKTLSIHRNGKSDYGLTFHFGLPDKDDNNRARLNKEFLGLSVTLALLQEQVTNAASVLGKTGMRQSGPRSPYPIGIPIEGDNTNPSPSMVTHPTIEFHTQPSLLNRIWLSINHRWLALHLLEHLFRQDDMPWSYQEALVFSFQMMAPCGPCRYEFLSPLVGYCMRFPTEDSIKLKQCQLLQIWKDPSTFLSYGNSCLMQYSTEARTQIVLTCFQDLASDIPPTSRKISYNRDSSWMRRWTCLRAYIFHFWLESSPNTALKSIIQTQLCAMDGKKKRKRAHRKGPITPKQPLVHTQQHSSQHPSSQGIHESPSKVQRRQRVLGSGGYHSMNNSRRVPNVDTTNTSAASNALSPSNILEDQVNLSIPNLKWADVRLATSEEMDLYVKSFLLIHRNDSIDLAAELSPLEVYSANHLHDLMHSRISGKPPFYPKEDLGPVVLNIKSEADHFIDIPSKSFHVAREQSQYFQEYLQYLPSMDSIRELCDAIVSHGHVDSKRAVGQYRVNIGNGGQNWQNGSPCKLHGLQFQKDLENTGKHDVIGILQTIGQLVEFTWWVICRLQDDALDHPIAPDSHRKHLYASHLCNYLQMGNNVAFEDLTLVVSSLYPITHQVKPHKDIMNDTISGYTRTAAFNMVLINDQLPEKEPTILLFQVICNFRKVIGCYLTPFHKYISPVAQHAKQYLQNWNRSINSVFAGKTEKIPTAFDRSGFFLDDTLEYTSVSISEEGKHKQSLHGEYILTEVNISRTLSLSMFINPIVKLQGHLKFDQTIELVFACSFLSNPFWFDWAMDTIIQRLHDPSESYALGTHPFYDWVTTTINIFGTWQGGPYNRWSPCGGTKVTVIETFGAQPGATLSQREVGENLLSQVVSVLCEHVEWINSLSGCGKEPVIDMPLLSMKAKCEGTIKDIAKIVSCQFSHFRLGIFTTILSGCGLLKEGRHLRNLMYPVKGAASYKHLSAPIADYMSGTRARELCTIGINVSISNDGEGFVPEDLHDRFMQHLSYELGFKVYVRDEIECILCESHPMRSLNCRDWFRKGISLFDCNQEGEFFCREYGKDTHWVKLCPPLQYEYAYVRKTGIVYIPVDVTLSCLAEGFGKALRDQQSKIHFKGRDSKTSSHQRTYNNLYSCHDTYQHPSMKMADFYMASQVKRLRLKRIFVLGDAEGAMETTLCNNLEIYHAGKRLYQYLSTLRINSTRYDSNMAAGCYHMDSELNNDEVTFFPGHLDKRFVHTAWFVPLGMSSFFAVLSVRACYAQEQDSESLLAFEQWKNRLSIPESKKVDAFLHDFDVQAKRFMREESIQRYIYLCKPGSVLSFPANECYHATISPKKPSGYPRDMFVFHPLDGIM